MQKLPKDFFFSNPLDDETIAKFNSDGPAEFAKLAALLPEPLMLQAEFDDFQRRLRLLDDDRLRRGFGCGADMPSNDALGDFEESQGGERSAIPDNESGYRKNGGGVFKSIKAALTYMNRHFAYVRKHGVMEVILDPEFNRLRYDFLKVSDAANLLASMRVKFSVPDGFDKNGKEKVKLMNEPAFKVWFSSIYRRQYSNGMEFHPVAPAIELSDHQREWLGEHNVLPHAHETREGVLNLWRGFAVAPLQSGAYVSGTIDGEYGYGGSFTGGWSKLSDHLFHNLCGGNFEYYNYTVSWAALMIQQPQIAAEVSLVFRGAKGAGKGLFFRTLLHLLGQHGKQITNAAHLVEKFNAHLVDCVALFADEAFFAGDPRHEAVLKGLITEPDLPIEAKFYDVTMRLNRLHIMMAANAEWVVPATHDERRYFVLDVLADKVGDFKYWKAIVDQLEDGGYEAMLYDLATLPLCGFQRAQGAGYERHDVAKTAEHAA